MAGRQYVAFSPLGLTLKALSLRQYSLLAKSDKGEIFAAAMKQNNTTVAQPSIFTAPCPQVQTRHYITGQGKCFGYIGGQCKSSHLICDQCECPRYIGGQCKYSCYIVGHCKSSHYIGDQSRNPPTLQNSSTIGNYLARALKDTNESPMGCIQLSAHQLDSPDIDLPKN